MNRFLDRFAGTILDVGGVPSVWTGVGRDVTVLNSTRPQAWQENGAVTFVLGDGTSIHYPDEAFDVVHCNSVIEHLGSYERQARMAAEIRRVGRAYWVQTPARSFPIEPHYLTPFVHWLPRQIRRRVLPYTTWALIAHPSQEYMDSMIAEIRPVSRRELEKLFPDAVIFPERFMGLVKSWIATRDSLSRVRQSSAGRPNRVP
jgi:hypothetical protein